MNCTKVVTELLDDDLADSGEGAAFVPAVGLNAGFLPGSVAVSTAASTTPGRGGGLDRATMPPYVRAAIQAGSAGTIAVIVGDLVSGPRLYWAVLATFLAFMATTNSGEQVRKALFRVSGTAIGIVAGDLLVRLTGGYVWTSLAIVLVALFFGIYLIRINYTFMVIGITVTMSQLYKQLGEFSWHLLLLRLGETAIGVGAVVVTVLVIVPLRPQRVLTTGVLLWFRALNSVIDAALDQLLGAPSATLRPAVRSLDAAYAALEATALPLRRATFGRNSAQLTEIQSVSGAARSYARSLAVAVETIRDEGSPELARAAEQLRASAAAIEARIDTGEHGRYVRSAALIDVAAHAADVVPTTVVLGGGRGAGPGPARSDLAGRGAGPPGDGPADGRRGLRHHGSARQMIKDVPTAASSPRRSGRHWSSAKLPVAVSRGESKTLRYGWSSTLVGCTA